MCLEKLKKQTKRKSTKQKNLVQLLPDLKLCKISLPFQVEVWDLFHSPLKPTNQSILAAFLASSYHPFSISLISSPHSPHSLSLPPVHPCCQDFTNAQEQWVSQIFALTGVLCLSSTLEPSSNVTPLSNLSQPFLFHDLTLVFMLPKVHVGCVCERKREREKASRKRSGNMDLGYFVHSVY